MTISLKITDVPEYLKLSKLYDSLLELDNESSFDIPIEFFKKELIFAPLSSLACERPSVNRLITDSFPVPILGIQLHKNKLNIENLLRINL